MNTTFKLAVEKVSALPEEAQERIGFELLDRVAALEELRAELQIGINELDAGLGRVLDIEELLKDLNARHGR